MRKIILLFLVLSCFSCANFDNSYNKESVGHVVLIWLNESGNQQHIEQLVSISMQLLEIEEIRQLHVGTAIPSDRNIVDDSFDVGIYMTFESAKDMEAYLQHPKHKNAVREFIKPLAKKIVVYDLSI